MKILKSFILSLIIMTSLTACSSESENEARNTDSKNPQINSESADNNNEQGRSYTVKRVVDGDTIIVDFNGTQERVRLTGVDTPESVHPDASRNVEFGKVSSSFTKNYLEGKKVTLEFDVQERDKYSRLLAYVYVDGEMFNNILLEEGMAKVATFPPNVKYADLFVNTEKKARENNKGLWALFDKSNAAASPPVNTPYDKPADPAASLDQKKDGKWIKGNKNSLIYHVPGGADYDKISPKNIIWFETEKEAQDKGYKRAKQ